MEKARLGGYQEFTSTLSAHHLSADLEQLRQAMHATEIHTFGWPLGVVMPNEEYRPRPSQDGIQAEIDRLSDAPGSIMRGYDYWALRRDGTFHLLSSLFEDSRSLDRRVIFLDTRAVRATEIFLRTGRLYEALGVPPNELVGCRLVYGGLSGRVLSVANQMRMPLFPERICSVDQVGRDYQVRLAELFDPDSLKSLVFETVKGIAEVCDFFSPGRGFTDEIVDAFLQGRVI